MSLLKGNKYSPLHSELNGHQIRPLSTEVKSFCGLINQELRQYLYSLDLGFRNNDDC